MNAGGEQVSRRLVAPGHQAGEASKTYRVPLASLVAGDSPRLHGEDTEHIRMLTASGSRLPPILVHRRTMRVIDGMHRLRVAKLRGDEEVEIVYFDGTADEAFIKAVEANVKHGLPLTLADREAAARRIATSYAERSDRWIASISGLSAGTVGSIRRGLPTQAGPVSRIGKDGRVRPVSSLEGRRVAEEAIARNPNASLREIAKIAGISPGTVRDVRRRLTSESGPDPETQATGDPNPSARTRSSSSANNSASETCEPRKDRLSIMQSLRRDPSIRYSESGRALLGWVHARAAGPGQAQQVISAAPPHCVYLIAQVARSCAEEWLELAADLESRMHG